MSGCKKANKEGSERLNGISLKLIHKSTQMLNITFFKQGFMEEDF